MARVRIVLKALLLGLAALCGLAAVAAQGGRWSGHLDIFTHFAPLYLVVAVIALFAAMLMRGSRYQFALTVAGGTAAISAISLILPEFMAESSPPAPAGAEGQIKVIQFNGNAMPKGAEAAIDWIAREKPDAVIIVQGSPRLLRGIRERWPLKLICGPTCEVAILGQAPADHPFHAPAGVPRSVAFYPHQDELGSFLIVGAHHSWPTNARLHQQNSDDLVAFLRAKPQQRIILLGDFNSTPWSFARRREDAALGMERRTRAMFSWPAGGFPGFPFLPIDHVYAGPGWRTVEVRRGPDIGSDHYPIVVTLTPTR